MPLTINPNLHQGDLITLTYEVYGSAYFGPNNDVAAMAFQIDNNSLEDIVFSNSPDPGVQNQNDAEFFFQIDQSDCPFGGDTYSLTIYVWDSNGILSTFSVTFQTTVGP